MWLRTMQLIDKLLRLNWLSSLVFKVLRPPPPFSFAARGPSSVPPVHKGSLNHSWLRTTGILVEFPFYAT